jgi:formylglycine-generating enzyme required for sulfatase activity
MTGKQANTLCSTQTSPWHLARAAVLSFTFFVLLVVSPVAKANDIRISNTRLENRDTTQGIVQVGFDLAWNNSWRLPFSLAPANWDAAWVFVKFRIGFVHPLFNVATAGSGVSTLNVNTTLGLRVGMPLRITAGAGTLGTNTRITAIDTAANQISLSTATTGAITDAILEAERIWEAAWLNDNGHTVPVGSTFQIGLPDESVGGGGYNASTNPGIGAFIYRSSPGSGDFSLSDLGLRWNYRLQGVNDNDIVDVQVFGIELVYVPAGSFFAGSGGTETSSFTTADNTAGATTPLEIGAAAPTLQGNDAGSDANNLSARGEWDLAGTATATLAADFPTGFAGFYSMKHEISQQAYTDFLNTLGRLQQNARTETALASGVTSVTNRFVLSDGTTVSNRNSIRCDATVPEFDPITFYCDLNSNGTPDDNDDGANLACSYISWGDVAAWLDWAGLRPLTELEFEKSCRGTGNTTDGAYAWGNTIFTEASGISSGGTRAETSSNSTANVVGNDNGGVQGPLRVGPFANDNSSRTRSGAGFYGILELSGNVWERNVTLGHADGRAFTGLHGNGLLTFDGLANVTNWPTASGAGIGFRGGSWSTSNSSLAIANRARAATITAGRENNSGGRGARQNPGTAAIIQVGP